MDEWNNINVHEYFLDSLKPLDVKRLISLTFKNKKVKDKKIDIPENYDEIFAQSMRKIAKTKVKKDKNKSTSPQKNVSPQKQNKNDAKNKNKEESKEIGGKLFKNGLENEFIMRPIANYLEEK